MTSPMTFGDWLQPWWSSWSESLWRASWQGALCALLVWGVARALPRLPASLRAGLWWLVALKFVLTLGWPRPMPIALLPAEGGATLERTGTPGPVSLDGRTSGSAAHTVSPAAVTPAVTVSGTGSGAAALEDARPSRAAGAGVLMAGTADAEARGPRASFMAGVANALHAVASLMAGAWASLRAHPWVVGGLWTLLFAWGAGVVWQVRGHVRAWRQVQGMRERARPFRHPVLEEEAEFLAMEAGLRRPPTLLVSDEVVSPLAAGLMSPVIVLPAKALRDLPEAALRMALAHEVAHLRRGDLWLGWVPALAETVLFFHPLARQAAREYALAREEACDAEALRLTGAEPADYGELLIAFGITRPPGSAAALGASAHLHALHRRLRMLEHVDVVPTRPRWWLKGAVFVLGAVALLPFQVVAKAPADTTQPAKDAGTGSNSANVNAPTVPRAPAPITAGSRTAPPAPPAPVVPPAPPTPVVARVPPTPAVAPVPPAPPAPVVARVPPAPVAPVPPAPPMSPRIASAPPPMPATPSLAAAPRPPSPPPEPPDLEDGETFAYLSDGRTMMSGSTEDLYLARTFKQPGKDLLFVRRDNKPLVIRDAKTLEQVRDLMNDERKIGDSQGALGKQQAALGKQQAALGQKQAELAYPQAQLVSKHMAIASRRADIAMERTRIAMLEDGPEKDRQEAELDKRDEALDKEGAGLDQQQEEIGRKMEALGDQQAKLGEEQAKLGEQQAKLGEEQAARSRVQLKKIRDLIDEAIRKGLAEPLPT
ncbi:M56 family metallopeptidase [Corallococcus sp. Z5C101001]|uniref:M56 family metallopeptidase n=1 Tax=Corallococcus sp. Z5C101001 TaxID=2596829 RepID=UPI0021048C66|nr:M56 family metallopeptidase [Corallococcus sp. Z5C101001]